MKHLRPSRLLSALALGAACALPVQAAVINFDGGLDTNLAPFVPLLNHGSEMVQDGFWIDMFSTKAGANAADLAGALVDGADVANTCAGLVCPTNNGTQFLLAVNDGLPDIGRLDGGSFVLKSFDASFVAAAGDVVPATALVLRVIGYDNVGTAIGSQDFELPGPVSGGYTFSTYTVGAALAATELHEVAFWAYSCNAAGICSRAQDKAQFGLDNITTVPEPSSFALVGLAFAGMGLARRRTQAKA